MFKIKLVGKRQLQRRIKKQTQSFLTTSASSNISNNDISCLNTCNNIVASTSNINNYNKTSHVIEDVKITENYQQNYSASKNVIDEINEPLKNVQESVSESDSFSDDADTSFEIREKLREWISQYNITRNATNALLNILNNVVPGLPKDYRTVMETPRITETINLNNGHMYYYGIENNVMNKLKSGIIETKDTILLQINVDGLPLFKSSATDLYPILGMSKEFLDTSPFTIALFCGNGKPDPLEIFLRNFIEELTLLRGKKINFQGKLFSIAVHFFIADAPARSYLRQTVGHTAKLGCEKCHIEGISKDHRITFSQKDFMAFPPKLDDDFTEEVLPKYIHAKSPLISANIKMVTQFPLDPMHLVFLGVVKRILLNYYFNVSSVKFSQKIQGEIEEKVLKIHHYISSDFSRKPRTFKELKRWKATEFKLFITYTFPVLFHNALHKEHYNLLLLLHCAVFILSDSNLIEKHINEAESFLKKFVVQSPEHFGESFVVFNVHNLIHLVNDVKLYGNINEFSCFPFENYMNLLKKKLHCANRPLQQIHRRIEEFNKCSSPLVIQHKKFEPRKIFNKLYDNEGKLCSFELKLLKIDNLVISVLIPDNCVILNSNKICVIKYMKFIEDKYIFEGLKFNYSENLYSKPIESSKLQIFYVSESKSVIKFSLSDISKKCMIIPHKEGFAVFPLNHSLIGIQK